MAQTIFITFGGGTQNYVDAGIRLSKQAYSTNIFTKILLYTHHYLHSDADFWNKHSQFILNNRRGYGYWLWKPYIIKKTMEQMKDGDIIFYSDGGCEISNNKKKQIQAMINNVGNDKLICSSTEQIEKKWCKMDLFVELNMNKDKYLDTEQYQASVIILQVCDKTRQFINEWYEFCSNYHFIDDSPSILSNNDDFIENRHDQSIFSLLFKKYEFPVNYTVKNIIEIVRNRTGKIRSKINSKIQMAFS
jgi:hypothetical protein